MKESIVSVVRAAAIVIWVALASVAVLDIHKSRLDIESVKDRVDVTTSAVRDLQHAVAPKADHWGCKAHDGKPEVDLGVPHPCDDGLCVSWHGAELNQSAVAARCESGKL